MLQVYLGSNTLEFSATEKPNKGHIGDGLLSLVERLSSSRRFRFKPIGNSLKTKITFKISSGKKKNNFNLDLNAPYRE